MESGVAQLLMFKRQVEDRPLSPQRLNPDLERILLNGDSESEVPSNLEGNPETDPEDSESDMGRKTSEDEDEVAALQRQVHELIVALKDESI